MIHLIATIRHAMRRVQGADRRTVARRSETRRTKRPGRHSRDGFLARLARLFKRMFG